jgi:hypothetical protein
MLYIAARKGLGEEFTGVAPGGVVTRLGLFAAPEFAVSYLILFILFFVVGWRKKVMIGNRF